MSKNSRKTQNNAILTVKGLFDWQVLYFVGLDRIWLDYVDVRVMGAYPDASKLLASFPRSLELRAL